MRKQGQVSKEARIISAIVFALLMLGLLPLSPGTSSHHDTDVGETQHTKRPDGQELEPPLSKQSKGPLSANALTANLPLSFEPNHGQTDSQVKFLARASGYNIFLTPTAAVFTLRRLREPRFQKESNTESEQPGRERVSVLRLTLMGANSQAPATGFERLPGVKNYLIGGDPSRWQTDVPTYRRVRFEEIYPGINLSYYGSQQQLEYDFEVNAGADPSRIRLSCDGARSVKIDADGNLVLKLKGGALRQHKPVIYQESNGRRVAIDGRFVIRGRREIGFVIGKHDTNRPLVIDPTLVYSTYVGAGGNDSGSSIDVDNAGNVYITGTTGSTTFPTQNPFHSSNAGLDDVFITKLNPAGSSILYSTYVGGSGNDRGDGIFVDRTSGAAYVVGRVDALSVDFPTTSGSFATTYRGGDFDAFVLKLNPAGNSLAYSTFLGGEENDSAVGVAADSSGNVYVTGGTRSDGFPATPNAFQFSVAGDTDAYLVKLNAAGSNLLYSTLLGGGATDRGSSVRVDSSGDAYFVGFTSSLDFPTQNAFQNSLAGSFDAFVARIDPSQVGANSLILSTYLGGVSDDKGYGLALDTTNDIYIAGQTSSIDFPVLNPVQPARGGNFDAFIAKITSAGVKTYATYLGGSGDDRATAIAVNSDGNAYITGFTASSNFPTAAPLQLSNGGGIDAFVTKLSTSGNGLVYSTYLGGSGNENFASTTTFSGNIVVDSTANAYITGFTASTNFPTASPLQVSNGGATDAFILKLSDSTATADFSVSAMPTSQTVNPGNSTQYDATVTPSGGFLGNVALAISGLPSDASGSFNPTSVSINDANARSSVLTITTTLAIPPGTYPLNVTATSGNIQHSTPVSLVVPGPTSANLSIVDTASPNPGIVGATLTYRIIATNSGPSPASNVTVTDTLPAGVNFASATPTQGSCSGTATVTCNLGNLATGNSATVNIAVVPQAVGQLTNTATVNASETDPDTINNSSTIITNVTTQASGPSMLDPNLTVHTVVSGLSQPTCLAFIGMNDFLVLEKDTGRVRRVTNGVIQGTVLDLAVNTASERGLLGIALHPAFALNGLVYLYWTESSTGADSANLADVPLLGNRVDRFIWNGASLTFDRNLIHLRAYQADAGQPLRGNHNGGIIRFGPDGKLFILMGDNGRRGFLQNVTSGAPVPDDQYGGPEPDDAHLTGFILRLNDDGSTPTDNPFYNASTSLTGQAAANIKKLYAYGVRNGFGMAFDPLSGNLWDQENGDDAFDEMNRITAGANNGWVQAMGPIDRIAQFKQIETTYGAGNLQQLRWPPSLIANTPQDALTSLYMLPGAHYNDPEFSWKYAVPASPLGFVEGRGLGPQFEGDMFVGAARTFLSGGFLFRFKLTPDRLHFSFSDSRLNDLVADNLDKFDITESESLLIGKDFGITTDIQTGPNGNLFVVSNTNSSVYEISGTQPTLFFASLNGAQEVPPNTSTATGTATLLLSPDETSARLSLNFSGLSSPESVSHIHGPGAPGVNAPVLFPVPQGNITDFLIPLTSTDVQNLRNGLLYINVHSNNFSGGEIRGQFQTSASASSLQFNSAGLLATEGGSDAVLKVTRLGDTSSAATVNYATSDSAGTNNCNVLNGNASSRCDYETKAGTLHFAAGETSKTISIPIVDDAYAEGSESFIVSLDNATGAILGSPGTVTVTINDNETVNGANPIDQAGFFVRQHYIDFLNREPDPAGFAFWTNQITDCGSDQACIEIKRINVSAAFFLSIEFQETGYLVERLYKSAYGDATGTSNFGPTHQLAVPIVRFNEFLPDTQQIGNGVVIGQPGADQLLESNKQAFLAEFVQRTRFTTAYPSTLTPGQFVDALFANTGVTPSASERTSAIDEFGGASTSADVAARARALRKVAENATLKQQEVNKAFVLMQYFGYLRRNPNDPQDTDYSGYDFWFTKLNQFGGNFVNADMVKAFIVSGEYRGRFGQ